ncbi:MAG: PTS sugar transporter subunit IIA, partial [Deltaproteobacteria bacterium]|nr:PTS sugar transporter subunit IIA [Deltaproteobacteria bacterium]
ICFIAKIKNGVDLETYDGERVRLIFVLLSPISQPELHLRLLAQIAKVTSSLDMVNKLVETPNPDDLIRVLSLV